MECKHFRVAGRVQGVFYRASTQSAAQRLGLVGWVRNCSNGDVELVAVGTATQLAELERWLWQGPALAQVQQVSVRPHAQIPDAHDFQVVP